MIRETAVTNQELADLHSDCATNIEKPCNFLYSAVFRIVYGLSKHSDGEPNDTTFAGGASRERHRGLVATASLACSRV